MDNYEINKTNSTQPSERKGGRYMKADSDNSNKAANVQRNVLGYLHDLVYLLAGLLFVLLLLFRIVVVSGPSMNDTLVHGDYVILLNNVLFGEPKQGDIIVASKDSFKDGEPIIKRVIATEGQEVDIDFIAGIVYVDGVALEEDYIKSLTKLQEGMKFPLIVDEGCIFVMGDNRGVSKDSRNPEIGLIDTREVLGKAIFLMLPGKNPDNGSREFSRIGAL